MAAKFKFVDDVRSKIKEILDLIGVPQSQSFIVDELKNLVSAHSIKDLLESLPPEEQQDYLEKFRSMEKDKYLIEFRSKFDEEFLEKVYLENFQKVMQQFLSKTSPNLDSTTQSRIESIMQI